MPADTPLTLSLVLTAAGALAAAGLVTGLVQLFKSVWPGDGLTGVWQLRFAFIFAAILTILAYADGVDTGAITVNLASLFVAFLAWYAIARLSKTIYDDVTKAPGSLREP